MAAVLDMKALMRDKRAQGIAAMGLVILVSLYDLRHDVHDAGRAVAQLRTDERLRPPALHFRLRQPYFTEDPTLAVERGQRRPVAASRPCSRSDRWRCSAAGGTCRRIPPIMAAGAAKARLEPVITQHAQHILGNALGRLADKADAAGFQIGQAASRVGRWK